MRSTSESARTLIIERQKCATDDLPPYVTLAHRHLEKAPSGGTQEGSEIHCILPVDMIRKSLDGIIGDPILPPSLVHLVDGIEEAFLIYQKRT